MKLEKLLNDVYQGNVSPDEAENMMIDESRAEGGYFTHDPSVKIRVYVKEEGEKKVNLRLSLPMWLVKTFGNIGLGIGSMALRNGKARDEMQAKGVDPDMIANLLDSGMLGDIMECMSEKAPVDIVNVESHEKDENVIVKISIE